ncbi:hypothetical protein VCRA2117O380_20254 [Vibrio crassostreae]|nr:hypothetical protein VCRA2117O379_20254 [Vibrio crassostreae]CAK2004006.1 hypothetical protein VCRA2117O380_20254 [Vibrio crassostreae]CAK2221052.1 hypothetical protein VCRA2119O381_70050 [Vibrio crassostreae]CAK2480738.1 hypothetical protein VCRA2113O350_20254 [Vibrio crassostreae]CAK2869053.1 hypothetical protein VCRA2119O383_20238 [Vibrio crassostreae]
MAPILEPFFFLRKFNQCLNVIVVIISNNNAVGFEYKVKIIVCLYH